MPTAGLFILIGLLSLSGCTTAPIFPSKDIPSSKDVPPSATGSMVAITPPSLNMASEKRLQTCSQDGICDRLHFMNALLALQGDPESAAAHFREVISIAPKTELAHLSRSWLKTLGSKGDEKRVVTETTDWLVELLKRDKKIEELSKQLNALKLVDLEMKERTSRMKPRLAPLPNQDGNP